MAKLLVPLLLLSASWIPLMLLQHFDGINFRKGRKRQLMTDKLLRPPGHTLRREIEAVDEKLLGKAFTSLGVPTALAWLLMHVRLGAWQIALACGVIAFIATLLAQQAIRLGRKRRALFLGLEGELAVAELLNELRADGYFIFHDYPTDYGNIDHIILGRGGVFAVETKARRKSTGEDGHKVFFRNGALHFPLGRDEDMIPQTVRQAQWLQKHLSRALGSPVPLEPILALPGWFVERQEKPPCAIVNPKAIRSMLLKSSPRISDQDVARLRFQIEERVRDVEI